MHDLFLGTQGLRVFSRRYDPGVARRLPMLCTFSPFSSDLRPASSSSGREKRQNALKRIPRGRNVLCAARLTLAGNASSSVEVTLGRQSVNLLPL